jgi:Fe-S oxidoreductase
VEQGSEVRAALFITCFNDLLFPAVGAATVKVLERVGVDVEFPQEQTCRGQMHFNTGYRDTAWAGQLTDKQVWDVINYVRSIQ